MQLHEHYVLRRICLPHERTRQTIVCVARPSQKSGRDVLDPACMLPPLFMLPAEMLSAAAAAAAASAVALGQTAAQQARMHACTRARTAAGTHAMLLLMVLLVPCKDAPTQLNGECHAVRTTHAKP